MSVTRPLPEHWRQFREHIKGDRLLYPSLFTGRTRDTHMQFTPEQERAIAARERTAFRFGFDRLIDEIRQRGVPSAQASIVRERLVAETYPLPKVGVEVDLDTGQVVTYAPHRNPEQPWFNEWGAASAGVPKFDGCRSRPLSPAEHDACARAIQRYHQINAEPLGSTATKVQR